MVKFMFAFLLLTTATFAQDPDWLASVPPPAGKAVQAEVEEIDEPEVPAEAPVEVPADVSEGQPTPAPEAQSLIDELLAAAKEARDAAQEAREAAMVANTSVSVVKSFDTLTMDDVNDAIRAALADRPSFTEQEIRAFAKDEIKKYLEAQVRTSSGEVKTIKSNSLQMTVNGYEGTFEVKEGERIIAIDGKPVSNSKMRIQTPQGTVFMASSPDYFLKTDPIPVQAFQAPQTVRFQQSRPLRFFNSGPARCVNGNCN
jgi:hypothetical protein